MTRATELRDVTTSQTSTPIVALVLGREERARVESALAGEHPLTFVSSLEEVRCALTRTEQAVLIAEPRDGCGAPTAPLLQSLRLARCDLPIIGYCAVPRDDARDVMDLSNSGVHELLFRQATDSPFLIRQTLRSAMQACAASWILGRLSEHVTTEVRTIIRYCLHHPKDATTVSRVARVLGIHRKTLTNYCARAGAPVPGALIAWCRLLLAAQLLRSQLGSVEAVALQLDFPSATAFRNMLKRYTGLRPLDVRAGTGFEQMLAMFTGRLAAGRGALPEPAHTA